MHKFSLLYNFEWYRSNVSLCILPCSLEMLAIQNLALKCKEESSGAAKAICNVQIAFTTNETNSLYLGKCFHFHIILKFAHGSPGKVLKAQTLLYLITIRASEIFKASYVASV